jgi:hypothetical protein
MAKPAWKKGNRRTQAGKASDLLNLAVLTGMVPWLRSGSVNRRATITAGSYGSSVAHGPRTISH